MPPSILNHDTRSLDPVTEPFEAQTFVKQLAIEAFRRIVLPGLAWGNQRGLDSLLRAPGSIAATPWIQTPANARSADIAVRRVRSPIDLTLLHSIRPDGAGHVNRQTLPRVLINDGEAF